MSDAPQPARSAPLVQVTVSDMACGHCAAAITRAVESAMPGARVQADPATGHVVVEGGEETAVRAAIRQAGYTPSPT